MRLFENRINGIKRFESIDAEPLFACKARGSFNVKQTPWLKINCNKDYKKKKRIKVAIFLLTIIIAGAFVSGISAAIYLYKKTYMDFLKFSESVASTGAIETEEKPSILMINAKNENDGKFSPDLECYESIKCDKSVIKDLKNLLNTAHGNGYNLRADRGYMSEQELTRVYNFTVQELMEEEGYTEVRADDRAQKMVSKAKYSEYTTGLLVDLVPEGDLQAATDSDGYRWLIRNCENYGFILRYPKNKENKTGRDYDPFCFRYVGQSTAKKMRSLSKCLEEYCRYLKLDYKY